MPKSQPYQPLALRLLHAAIASLILLALITGLIIYNVYDGRIGHLPLPAIPRIMGIHKLFGRLFLLIIPVFALYSFHAGRRKLIQPDSLKSLKAVGKPIWWYTLHRLVNTLLLMAATLALVTGREMEEKWLKVGDLNHLWYSLHLASWVIIAICLVAHLLMIIKVGGVPLMLSILTIKYRSGDSPTTWAPKLRKWLHLNH
jgi:hypothetical protein